MRSPCDPGRGRTPRCLPLGEPGLETKWSTLIDASLRRSLACQCRVVCLQAGRLPCNYLDGYLAPQVTGTGGDDGSRRGPIATSTQSPFAKLCCTATAFSRPLTRLKAASIIPASLSAKIPDNVRRAISRRTFRLALEF